MFKLVVFTLLVAYASAHVLYNAETVVPAPYFHSYASPVVKHVAPAVHTYAAAPIVQSYAAAPIVQSYAAAPIVQSYAAAPVIKTVQPIVHTPVIKTVQPIVHTPAVAVGHAITKTVHYESKPVVTGYTSEILKPNLGALATPLNTVTQERVLAPARTVATVTPQITQVHPELHVQKVAYDVPVAKPFISEVEVRQPAPVIAPVPVAAPVHVAHVPAVPAHVAHVPAVAAVAEPVAAVAAPAVAVADDAVVVEARSKLIGYPYGEHAPVLAKQLYGK